MAKKKKLETDDFDFDSGLDMPDFDFDLEPPKDDRKPVTKFAGGVVTGAKDSATSPEFIKRLLRDSLPKGYGQVMDLTDQGASTLRNLYNTAAKDLKPAITDIKRATNKILPSVESALPKNVAEKLRNWSKEENKDAARASAEAMRESALQADLTDIFSAQTEIDQKNRTEDRAEAKLRDAADQQKHTEQMGQYDAMRQAIQQGVSFDTKITAKYQRKHLEIAYRQYFMQSDLLEETRKYNAESIQKLEGILKNTGLPEFAKLKNSERLHEVLRNKFIDGINDTIFAKRRDFINNVGKRMLGATRDKMRGFADAAAQGAGMVESLADLRQMQAEFGGPQISGAEMAGGVAGGMLADSAGARIGKWARSKADQNEKIVRGGNRLSAFVTSLPQYAEQWARSGKGENTGFGFLDNLVRFGKDNILGSLGGQDVSIQQDKLADGNNPDVFGRRTNKSITEIIPGYLARIWREIKILRTGDESTQLVEYDFLKNKFSDRKTIGSNIRNQLVGEREVSSTRDQVDRLVNELDREGKLTPEERKILGRKLLQDNLSNKLGSADRLSDANEYGGMSADKADRFAKLFKDYFADDTLHDKRRVFGEEFNNLGRYISDNRANIQHHVNAGNSAYLEEMGLIDANGQIDMNRLYEYYYGEDYVNGNQASQSQVRSTQDFRRISRQRGNNSPRNTIRQMERPAAGGAMIVMPPQQMAAPVQQANQSFNFDSTQFDKIVEAIKTSSVVDRTETISETLLRIEAQIGQGIPTFNMVEGAPEGWSNMRLRDVPGGLMRAGRNAYGKIRAWGKDRWNKGVAQITTAKNWLSAKKDQLKIKMNSINDVYVKGELIPRLTKAGIEAGKYRDKLTGKVIEKWSDIKGDVIDEDGNIIMTREAWKNAIMKTNLGEKAVKGFIKLKDAATGAAMWGVAKLRGAAGGVYGLALQAAEKLWELTDKAQDVYVTGETAPRLLGITMKAGGYASRTTSKTITKPSQIDGPVYDTAGQLVLTEEDLKKGLVDVTGRPIVTGWKKVLRVGMDLIKKVKDKAIWAKDKLLEFGRKSRDFLTDKLNLGALGEKLGRFFTVGPLGISAKKTVDLLTEIRNILNDRLPGKKRTLGDTDGDGIREGSYADLQRKKKEGGGSLKDKFEKLKGDGFAKSKDLGQAIIDKAKGVLSFFNRKKKGEDEDEEGGLSIDDLPDLDGPDDRRGRWGRRARRFGRKTKSMASRAGRGLGRLGRGVGSLGRGALTVGRGALALGGLGASGLASAATGAAGLAGTAITGIGSAAGAVGGALATGAGAIATGLGAIFTAPVLLTALGVAALGAGAYYGYKYLTRKKLGTLSKIRYAQYGFLPTDEDHLQKVFGLEDDMVDGVAFSGGKAYIDEKKVDIVKAIENFGIDPRDENARAAWVQWFASRFKPVFLVHMNALAGLKEKKKLSDVDDLKGEDRKTYFNAIKMNAGVYGYQGSPFHDLPKLLAGQTEVDALIQAASTEIAKDDKGSFSGALSSELAKSSIPSAAMPSAVSVLNGDSSMSVQNVINDMKLDAAGVPLSGSGVVAISSAEVLADVINTGRVDALTAIRMRTYGLKELTADKVRTLQKVESMVLSQVTWQSDTAVWNGSIEAMINDCGAAFGVSGTTNRNATDWLTWFAKRFLPTYLKYLTVLKKVSGKSDMKVAPDTLKPQQKLDVAMVVYTASTNYNERSQAVWNVPESPWPGYEMNMDVKSIDGNLQSLKDGAQQATMDEEKGKVGKSGLASDNSPSATPAGATGSKPGFFSRFFKGQDEDGNKASGGWFSNAKDTIKEAMGFGGGKEVEHPGKGAGGDINSLPKPSGKGYAAMKELLAGVAKMTGVDEKLLASIIAVESGFDPLVKAASSSATGLGQFIKGTWQTMLSKYGAKYGIAPDTPPTDARANALMTAEFLKENANTISGAVNRKLTDTDLYFAHFLGAGGAKKFLASDPAKIAADMMPDAARANPSIFYDKTGRPLTVGEVYALVNGRVRAKAKKLGVDDGSEKLQAIATTTKPADKDSKAPSTEKGPVTSNPIGDFKVTDPVPGMPVSSQANVPVSKTPTPAAETPKGSTSSTPEDSNPLVDTARRAGGGFQTPRSASVMEQTQFQSDMFKKVFGNVDDTLIKSLRVQEEMREHLKTLVEQGRGFLTGVGKKEEPKPEASATIQPKAAPRAMPAPPVSLGKSSVWTS